GLRAPKHRSPLATGTIDPSDFCWVGLPLPHGQIRPMAIVPLTQLGADYLDEQADLRRIVQLSDLPWQFWTREEARILRRANAVVLPREAGVPDDHRVGIYKRDGHSYVAQRDRAGALLFFQTDGNVVRTDMFALLQSTTP